MRSARGRGEPWGTTIVASPASGPPATNYMKPRVRMCADVCEGGASHRPSTICQQAGVQCRCRFASAPAGSWHTPATSSTYTPACWSALREAVEDALGGGSMTGLPIIRPRQATCRRTFRRTFRSPTAGLPLAVRPVQRESSVRRRRGYLRVPCRWCRPAQGIEEDCRYAQALNSTFRWPPAS